MQLDFTVQGFFCEGFFLIFGEIGCKFTSYINCGWQASVCTSGRIEGNAWCFPWGRAHTDVWIYICYNISFGLADVLYATGSHHQAATFLSVCCIIILCWFLYQVFPVFCYCFKLPSCSLHLIVLFSSAHQLVRLCMCACLSY